MSQLVLPGECIRKSEEKYKGGTFTHTIDGEVRSSCMGIVKIHLHDGINVIDVIPFRKPGVVPSAGSVVLAKVTSLTRRVVRCDVVAVGDQPLAGPFRGLIRREDIRATQRDQAEPAQCFRPGDLVRARVLNLLGPGAGSHCTDEGSTAVTSVTNNTFLVAQAVSASVGATSDASSSASASSSMALCLLTTAEPDLGVVLGLGRAPTSELVDLVGSTGGSPLVPVAWTEMICPHTLTRFSRKVARVPVELLNQLVQVETE